MDIKKIGIFLAISGVLLPYTSIYENVKTEITKYSTRTFFWISKQIAKVKINYNHLYNENSLIKGISDWTIQKYKLLEPLMTNKKCEPNYNTWIMKGTLYYSTFSLPENLKYRDYYFSSRFTEFYKNINLNTCGFYNFEKYDSLEDYKIATDCGIYNKLMFDNFYNVHSNHCIKSFLEIKNNSDNSILNKDNFTIMKYDDKTHIVNICKPISEIPKEFEIKHSNIHFISIEYKHPEMETPLFLEIPMSYYIVGNELFSSGFILRCLEYQYTEFKFDNKYEVSLMDNEIRMETLQFGQYVKILEDKYEIINNNNNNNIVYEQQ